MLWSINKKFERPQNMIDCQRNTATTSKCNELPIMIGKFHGIPWTFTLKFHCDFPLAWNIEIETICSLALRGLFCEICYLKLSCVIVFYPTCFPLTFMPLTMANIVQQQNLKRSSIIITLAFKNLIILFN